MTFEEYIKGMTTRDLVAQLICPALRATYRENSDPREYFVNVFTDKDVKPGSVFMFPSEKSDIKNLTKKLTDFLGKPPLICADIETSPSTIFGAPNFGSAMAISAANSAEDAYTCGEACAKEALSCGINWALGPVLDLCNDPGNSINTRSWGSEPDHVYNMVESFSNGMTDNGIMPTAKHFPSCNTQGDTHLASTVCKMSMDEWEEREGKVWRGIIENGIRAIMPSHTCFPAAEDDGKLIPCTLSYNVVTKLIRQKLGFDGLIVSDGFNMGGLVPYIKYDKAFVRAINAGIDVLLFTNFCTDMTETVDILENAVNNGEISIDRVKESVYRIWREKKRLGLFDDSNKLYNDYPQEDRIRYDEVAKRIGENSIVIYKNDAGVLPLNKDKIKKVISVDITNAERPIINKLDEIFGKNGIEIAKYGNHTENGIVGVTELPKADALILNFYYTSIWAADSLRPSGRMLQKIYEYIFKPDIPVVMICHGSPFIPYTFPYIKTVVNTYSEADINPNTIYEVLFGIKEAKGKTPVTLDIWQPDL